MHASIQQSVLKVHKILRIGCISMVVWLIWGERGEKEGEGDKEGEGACRHSMALKCACHYVLCHIVPYCY